MPETRLLLCSDCILQEGDMISPPVQPTPNCVCAVRRLPSFGQDFVDLVKIDVAIAHSCYHWRQGGDVYDSRSISRAGFCGFDELWHDEAGGEEVSDLVGCKLHLESVFAERALWEVHHGGVIHEHVHGGDIFPVENIGRRFTDRFLAGEVQLEGECTVVY